MTDKMYVVYNADKAPIAPMLAAEGVRFTDSDGEPTDDVIREFEKVSPGFSLRHQGRMSYVERDDELNLLTEEQAHQRAIAVGVHCAWLPDFVPGGEGDDGTRCADGSIPRRLYLVYPTNVTSMTAIQLTMAHRLAGYSRHLWAVRLPLEVVLAANAVGGAKLIGQLAIQVGAEGVRPRWGYAGALEVVHGCVVGRHFRHHDQNMKWEIAPSGHVTLTWNFGHTRLHADIAARGEGIAIAGSSSTGFLVSDVEIVHQFLDVAMCSHTMGTHCGDLQPKSPMQAPQPGFVWGTRCWHSTRVGESAALQLLERRAQARRFEASR